jgi:hypothetical protein
MMEDANKGLNTFVRYARLNALKYHSFADNIMLRRILRGVSATSSVTIALVRYKGNSYRAH